MPTFGARLVEERERLGLTQAGLADIAGVTLRSQRNYEKDGRVPDAQYLAWAAAAGIDVLYVITGSRGSGLSARAAALLDHYEHSDEGGKRLIEGTATLAAQPRRARGSA